MATAQTSAATTAELHPVARRYLRRNFWLGVANGALFAFGDSLQDTNLVLSVFVSRTSGSNLLVGLLQPVRVGGWFLPQLFVSARIQSAAAKLPYYRSGTVMRITAAFGVALATYLVGNQPRLLLPLVLMLFAVFSLAGGVSGMAFNDIVAKTVPSRMRGRFYAWRIFLGGLLALMGSLIVQRVLSPTSSLTFPLNYSLIFFLAACGIAAGMFSYTLVMEPIDGNIRPRARVWDQLRRASALPRQDPCYRRFIVTRIALVLAEVAGPFYIIYVKSALGLPDSIAGTYLMVLTGANILSTYAWGRISDGTGNRAVLRGVAVVGVTASMLALSLPIVVRASGGSTWPPVLLFGGVFALIGFTRTGINVGAAAFLLDVAPAHDRAIYIGYTNTLAGIATFATATGGLVADVFGYRALFVAALVFYLVAGVAIHRATEPRVESVMAEPDAP